MAIRILPEDYFGEKVEVISEPPELPQKIVEQQYIELPMDWNTVLLGLITVACVSGVIVLYLKKS